MCFVHLLLGTQGSILLLPCALPRSQALAHTPARWAGQKAEPTWQHPAAHLLATQAQLLLLAAVAFLLLCTALLNRRNPCLGWRKWVAISKLSLKKSSHQQLGRWLCKGLLGASQYANVGHQEIIILLSHLEHIPTLPMDHSTNFYLCCTQHKMPTMHLCFHTDIAVH